MKLSQITNTALKEEVWTHGFAHGVFLIGSLWYFSGILGDLMKDLASDEASRKKFQKIKKRQQQIRDQIKIKTQRIQQHFPGMGPEEIAEKAFQTIDDNRKNEIEQKVAVWVAADQNKL